MQKVIYKFGMTSCIPFDLEKTMNVINIKKSYGKKEILKNITFEAGSGECIGILGANGCGKSTLLGILSGVVRPDGGEFVADGVDLLKNRRARSAVVGYVPQSSPLLEELSAKDNLRLWYRSEKLKSSLSDGVLSLLGIGEFLRTPVRNLSGGMKKRLAIGCAVASDPKILILDEPGAALDIVCRESIRQYLKKFRTEGGIVIIATHDTGEIAMCDRLYILKNGSLVPCEFDGDVSRLARSL